MEQNVDSRRTRFYIKGGCSRIDRMWKWAGYKIRAKVLSRYSDWSFTMKWVSLISEGRQASAE